jgi:hypothetical protein
MTPSDPLAADLDLFTIPKVVVECPSSDPVSRFEDQDIRIVSLQVTGRHQAGEPRSDTTESTFSVLFTLRANHTVSIEWELSILIG